MSSATFELTVVVIVSERVVQSELESESESESGGAMWHGGGSSSRGAIVAVFSGSSLKSVKGVLG